MTQFEAKRQSNSILLHRVTVTAFSFTCGRLDRSDCRTTLDWDRPVTVRDKPFNLPPPSLVFPGKKSQQSHCLCSSRHCHYSHLRCGMLNKFDWRPTGDLDRSALTLSFLSFPIHLHPFPLENSTSPFSVQFDWRTTMDLDRPAKDREINPPPKKKKKNPSPPPPPPHPHPEPPSPFSLYFVSVPTPIQFSSKQLYSSHLGQLH